MADTANKVFQIDLTAGLKHRHYPVVFGAVCRALGLSCDAALASFMSGVARNAVASAVRLDKVGPIEVSEDLVVCCERNGFGFENVCKLHGCSPEICFRISYSSSNNIR